MDSPACGRATAESGMPPASIFLIFLNRPRRGHHTFSLLHITYYFPKIGPSFLVKSEKCGASRSESKSYKAAGGSFTLKNSEEVKIGKLRTSLADFWWGKVDSNHRSYKQQIYSLSPLATREFPHCVSAEKRGAGRRTRTPDLLITNQLLYRLSYTGISTEHAYYTGKGSNCQVLFSEFSLRRPLSSHFRRLQQDIVFFLEKILPHLVFRQISQLFCAMIFPWKRR